MALATVFLLLLAIIPHHHHQGFWCNVVEICVADNDANDQHTHHNDDHTSCVEKLSYVTVKASTDRQQQLQQLHHVHFDFSAIISLQNTLECTKTSISVLIADELNHSYYLKQSHSLRAPPIA